MPYIKLEDRQKYESFINETVALLNDDRDTIYIKGEQFGFFVNRLVRRFLPDPNFNQPAFNSFFFSEDKRKTIGYLADTVSALFNRADPIASAGDINYVISAVLWGLLGEAQGIQPASYGVRTYLRSMIEKVLDSVETINVGSQRDMSMTFRRHLIIRGVLADVVSETYRTKTAIYEGDKCIENGHIWVDGKLNLPPKITDLVAK